MLLFQSAEILHGSNRWEGRMLKYFMLTDGWLIKLHDSCIMSKHSFLSLFLFSYMLFDWWPHCLFSVSSSAPEAQRETVFVCAACNSSLVKLQWDGMSVSSLPWALQQVTETLTHDLVFNLGRSYLLRYLPYWTPRPSLPFPVASLLSCLCCFWDFYCNMFDISFFNSQWRTGP